MRRLKVECSQKLIQQFKARAKKAWPRETIAYLIGQRVGHLYTIEDLFFPDNVWENSAKEWVAVQPQWPSEAMEYAQEMGAHVIGDMHTHPRCYKDYGGISLDAGPSEGDLKVGWLGICGICVIAEQKSGRFTYRIRFFGPCRPVDQVFV